MFYTVEGCYQLIFFYFHFKFSKKIMDSMDDMMLEEKYLLHK